ncbi:IclR family transcriptional regulator [Oryzicola mucosus]|uniref:Helix-turn-helix domain-containing protein n=1 Tax=Oryzicola mucosus TaxID=2767425 RepID=A0A8J6U1U6_9HYPH|nr:helix-turn-helix domain-containing protein [Oryzicola mucosus]MBD0417341.1 helix-turn-helix domain-containing protein [Oryzicola mucosus]
MEDFESAGDGADVVKSVARTLEVLELFDEVRRPMKVMTVAAALGYPRTSTLAILQSLVSLGYVKVDSLRRTYIPTDRVSLLGCWMSPTLFAEARLPRLLQAITKRSGQMVVLGARNGDYAQYIQVLDPRNSAGCRIRLGAKQPLASSGVGTALLSAYDDNDVRRLFHRINAYRTVDAEPIQVGDLLLSLADIRRKRYFVSIDQVVTGASLIAMLMPTACTDRPLVVGIGVPTGTIREREDELVRVMNEEIDRFFGKGDGESRMAC